LVISMNKNKTLFAGLMLLASQAFAFPWYASGDNFRGAQLMTPEERKAHVARLQGMRSFDECRAYMSAHYLELDKRAKEKSTVLPPVQGDPCEVMRNMGRFR
jgi:hypothetical protein